MKNTTIGVDPSVSATGIDPSATAVTANSGITTYISSVPAEPIDFSKLPEATYLGYIQASNVQYYVAKLLGKTLSLVDASVPNKEQNKALKHLVRTEFDRAIMDVHTVAWPPHNDPTVEKAIQVVVTPNADGYILQPEK